MHQAHSGTPRAMRQRISGPARWATLLAAALSVACGGAGDATGPGAGGGGGGGGAPAVASVSVSAPSSALLVGVADASLSSETATATPQDANGNPLSGQTVTWSSSVTSVATVSSSGVITAVGAGTAVISAAAGQKSGQVSITVTRPAVASVAMSPASATVLTGVIDSTTLGVTTLTATP